MASKGKLLAAEGRSGSNSSAKKEHYINVEEEPTRRPSYRYIRKVGEGASGEAHLMEDDNGKQYIMKSIETSCLGKRELENAINEIRVLNELRHPFIVRYRESFIDGSFLRIIMGFCGGGDLHSRIQHQRKVVRKRFRECQIVRWLTQLVIALRDIHSRRVLHRDIKPLNIFLEADENRLRIGDFGISKVLDGTLAAAQSFLGTPHYMSPEVAANDGRGYGRPADIWSLGVVVYELATFVTPFYKARSLPELVGVLGNLKQPLTIPSGYYSAELIEVCGAMLQKDPAKRPTAEALLRFPIVQKGVLDMLTSTYADSPSSVSPFVDREPVVQGSSSSASSSSESSTSCAPSSSSSTACEVAKPVRTSPGAPGAKTPSASKLSSSSSSSHSSDKQKIVTPTATPSAAKQSSASSSSSSCQSSSRSLAPPPSPSPGMPARENNKPPKDRTAPADQKTATDERNCREVLRRSIVNGESSAAGSSPDTPPPHSPVAPKEQENPVSAARNLSSPLSPSPSTPPQRSRRSAIDRHSRVEEKASSHSEDKSRLGKSSATGHTTPLGLPKQDAKNVYESSSPEKEVPARNSTSSTIATTDGIDRQEAFSEEGLKIVPQKSEGGNGNRSDASTPPKAAPSSKQNSQDSPIHNERHGEASADKASPSAKDKEVLESDKAVPVDPHKEDKKQRHRHRQPSSPHRSKDPEDRKAYKERMIRHKLHQEKKKENKREDKLERKRHMNDRHKYRERGENDKKSDNRR